MSSYTEGQTHQLVNSLEAAGFTADNLTKLGQNPERLDQIKDVLDGKAEIKPIEHIVDCNAAPFTPDGWKAEEHKKGGVVKIERRGEDLYIDRKKVELYLSKRQCGDKIIEGHKLREELSKKEVKNACVLDYLLEHLDLIPDSWKISQQGCARCIYFWGTIYRDARGSLCVRYFYWRGGRWVWNDDLLDRGWDVQRPAAVSAK